MPIPKEDSGSVKTTVDNFRRISITPVVSKLFEHCLLELFSNHLKSSDNFQFGFKAKTSCSHALYSVRKTVEFCIDRDSTVNVCALDMSKAFDKLNRFALFIKLMNKKCPLVLIKILDCWYVKNWACVKWGKYVSPFVMLATGTRQGGITSPYLFAAFINDVIVKLQKSTLGCYIRNLCFNAFMFADDLPLLSISVADMQNMVNIVKSELDWLDMEINVKKSMCMRIGKRYDVAVDNICLAGKPIQWAREIKYLGLYLIAAASFKFDLHHAKVKFFRSLNGILGKLGASPPVSIVLHLVATYCNPVLFSGLDALHLSKANYSSLSYPYN